MISGNGRDDHHVCLVTAPIQLFSRWSGAKSWQISFPLEWKLNRMLRGICWHSHKLAAGRFQYPISSNLVNLWSYLNRIYNRTLAKVVQLGEICRMIINGLLNTRFNLYTLRVDLTLRITYCSNISTPQYYKLSMYPGYIWYDSAHCTTITVIKLGLDLHSRTTSHICLALTGELWDVFRELYKEKWPRYIESALYLGV